MYDSLLSIASLDFYSMCYIPISCFILCARVCNIQNKNDNNNFQTKKYLKPLIKVYYRVDTVVLSLIMGTRYVT